MPHSSPSGPSGPATPARLGRPEGGLDAPSADEGPGPVTEGSGPDHMLAAVDLGSNSFRMVIARVVGEELQLVDRLREGVRLAAYLDDEQRLTEEGRERALACLRIFGQRVRGLPHGNVRAVGTNTLRKARNTDRFLAEAEKALGHPIEVVSGLEEARLIFLGAAQSLSGGPARRLVLDIGGGSTELVVGEGIEPIRAESLYMGCVSYTLSHFPGGKITAKRMRRAETAARLELRAVAAEFRKAGWQLAVGASGTVQAIASILRLQGWSDQGITPEGLDRLRRELVDQGHTDQLRLEGMRSDRARVLPGGLAILSAVFDSLKIDRMLASSGAMREGVLHDLLGRLRHEDARDRTIQRLVEQYRVDTEQAARVERTVLDLLEQASTGWQIDGELGRAFASWASRVHEIGLAVAHGGHHKHAAYLLQHSDLPGFSYQNQTMLALLVRGERRKFPKSLFAQSLPRARAKVAKRLCLLLRLAILLNRSRNPRQTPPLRLGVRGKRLRLEFPSGWLERHPLTRADLEVEQSYLAQAGYRLQVRSADDLGAPKFRSNGADGVVGSNGADGVVGSNGANGVVGSNSTDGVVGSNSTEPQ